VKPSNETSVCNYAYVGWGRGAWVGPVGAVTPEQHRRAGLVGDDDTDDTGDIHLQGRRRAHKRGVRGRASDNGAGQ
jgi:hypothetical protein